MTSRTSLGGSAAMTYESTGVLACSQDGAGKVVTTSPSADTSYSLPGALTPNDNSNLATTLSYNSAWQATGVTGPNGSTATTTYDGYGRPSQSTIPEGGADELHVHVLPERGEHADGDDDGERPG